MADPTPAVATTTGSQIGSATIQRPANVTLSQAEQAAILKSAGYPGGTIVGGQAIPQPKMGTALGGASQQIDVGEYQVAIQDAQGNNIGPVTITKAPGLDEQGNPTWGLSDVPKTPTTAKDKPSDLVIKGPDNSAYYPDDPANPAGTYHVIVPGTVKNQDEEITKALEREKGENDRRRRQANETATGIYGTDAEVAKIQSDAAKDRLGQDELKQRISEFNVTARQKDEAQKTLDAKAHQDILQSQATTTKIGAETGGVEATTAQTRQNIDIQAKKAPAELAGVEATTEASKAQTERNRQLIAQGNAPTLEPAQAGMYITKRDPGTGATTQELNPAYVPKTQAEIAARTGQINELARAKQAELTAKSAKDPQAYTPDQAYSDFQAWWDQQVKPHEGALQAAQEDLAIQRAKDQAATRTAATTAATGASNAYTNAFQEEAKYRVGPGFGAAMDAARAGKPSGFGSSMYEATLPTVAAQQASMEALKYIDPTAAAATGAPPPNLQALAAQARPMLDRTQFQFGATAPPPPLPAPAPVAAAPAPAEPVIPPPGSPGLAPAGQAGVGGMDPRFAGANPTDPAQLQAWAASIGLDTGPPPAGMTAKPRIPSWSAYGYTPPDYSYAG